MHPHARPCVASLLWVVFGCLTPLALPGEGRAEEWDPLPRVLARTEQFFSLRAPGAILRDPRLVVHEPEEIRLNITAQLLAYCELYADTGDPRHLEAVILRADFLVARLDEIRTYSAFDGMLGYALLSAYAATGDPAYKAPVETIVARCKQLAGFDNTLNWGLMCAMCLSEVHAQGGDEDARTKVIAIINSLRTYQHENGSFPHYCPHSIDVHYTAWIGTELMLVERNLDYPLIGQLLAGIRSFLAERIDATGVPSYESCDHEQDCQSYYSRASGCPEDYDTRGWTNELAYHAVILRPVGSHDYYAVMDFLVATGTGGGYPDKWDFLPPAEDPIHIWATGSPSVLRTSLVFWLMAALQRGGFNGDPPPPRMPPMPLPPLSLAEIPASPSTSPRWPLDPVVLNPTSGAPIVRFALPAAQVVHLSIHDVSGRVVRELAGSELAAGQHAITWDGRNGAGATAARGIYFCRLDAGHEVHTRKIALVR